MKNELSGEHKKIIEEKLGSAQFFYNRTDNEQVIATELEQCEEYAKKLPLQERALLIKRLIEGLHELDEQNLERLWVQEAALRFKELKAENIKAQSAENNITDFAWERTENKYTVPRCKRNTAEEKP